MLKKPARVATGGTIQRQASQIAQEALALARLDGLLNGKAHPPRLLDQAPEYTLGTANYFIISETAPGEALTNLLSKSRQTGKPFPRRVIITVLDALFDMFSRAHQVGVLWNDVKLDHIYWHNATGQVAVIDWGNALFLDHHVQHALPRWQDYQQMIDTLGNFLQGSAPELYVDLGWEEFQGQTLDSPRVSILARRITYQQQVIAMQVMEYQSLIRVFLSADPSLEGLYKIAGYQQILEKIGAPWERDEVLKYSQSLVEMSFAVRDLQTGVRATALVWDIFEDTLDLSWHLLREYCRHTDILTHAAFPSLVKHTLNSHWTEALWAASTIASVSQDPTWWQGLIPVMRQKALGTATPPPYHAAHSLLKWAQEHQDIELTHKLKIVIQDWRHKGTGLSESPFEYELIDMINLNLDFPNRIRSEVKQSFAPGEEVIKELIKVWTRADWDALPKAFHRFISWDPDRWGILHLSAEVAAFQEWLQELYDGPGVGSNADAFLEQTLENRPEVERLLGSPPWIRVLINTLTNINLGAPINTHQDDVRKYCPWLLEFPDIHAAETSKPELAETALHNLLFHFIAHLKSWSDIDAGLVAVQEHAPEVYPLCKRLAEGFGNILALNVNLDQLKAIAAGDLPPELAEGGQVLQSLITWREHIADENLAGANQTLSGEAVNTWALAAHAHQITVKWQAMTCPLLEAMLSFKVLPDIEDWPSDPHLVNLISISKVLADIKPLWKEIFNSGIHAPLLETIEAMVENARAGFYGWRLALEGSSEQVERLLYHSQLDKARQVSTRLMHMIQHIRQAKLNLATLGEGDQASLTRQMRNIENILFHLSAFESELMPDVDQRRFQEYQSAFKPIAEAVTAEDRHTLITALPQEHPFYAWLVKSSLAQERSTL